MLVKSNGKNKINDKNFQIKKEVENAFGFDFGDLDGGCKNSVFDDMCDILIFGVDDWDDDNDDDDDGGSGGADDVVDDDGDDDGDDRGLGRFCCVRCRSRGGCVDNRLLVTGGTYQHFSIFSRVVIFFTDRIFRTVRSFTLWLVAEARFTSRILFMKATASLS